MNSDFMQEQSQAFAERLAKTCESRFFLRRQYRLGVRHCRARPPNPKRSWQKHFSRAGGSLADMCLALLNRNEFVYVQ